MLDLIIMLVKMLKNRKGMMGMMPSGMEAPMLFIGLGIGIFLAIAIYHWTGSNLCNMWPPKVIAVAAP